MQTRSLKKRKTIITKEEIPEKRIVRKTPVKKNKKEKDEKDEKDTQPKITDFYKKKEKEEKKNKKYGYDEETGCWYCIECGENMGPSNSRQLCGKFYCFYSPCK